jgi:hypothetical protein
LDRRCCTGTVLIVVHHIGAAFQRRPVPYRERRPAVFDRHQPAPSRNRWPWGALRFPQGLFGPHPAITVLQSKSVLTVERQHACSSLITRGGIRRQAYDGDAPRREEQRTRPTRPGSPAPRRQRDKLLKATNVRNGILPKSDAERLLKQAIAGNKSRNHQPAAELLGIVLQSLSEFQPAPRH